MTTAALEVTWTDNEGAKKGLIKIELDKTGTPIAAGNFENLVLGQYRNDIGAFFRNPTTGQVEVDPFTKQPKKMSADQFSQLVKKPFYDGLIFHRVSAAFMMQGGCPKGDGTGGPGYCVRDEFPSGNHNGRFTVAMANRGPDTGGCQFFINFTDNGYLDGKHTVFGKITDLKSREIVEAIEMVPVTVNDKTGEATTPESPVRIVKATIE
jgi:peptidylprolyl isomerase